jgi:hypothetical protein
MVISVNLAVFVLKAVFFELFIILIRSMIKTRLKDHIRAKVKKLSWQICVKIYEILE